MMKGVKTGILIIVISTFLITIAQIFLKKSMNLFDVNNLLPFIYFVVPGLALYAISALLMIISLKYGDLSILYPIYATSYIWVAILSSVLFSESLALTKMFGIGIIITGIILLAK